jgi:hypothetical protein
MNATSPDHLLPSCLPTLGRAIPIATDSLALRRLRDRYEDPDDPVVAAMPPTHRQAMLARIDAILDSRRRLDGAA